LTLILNGTDNSATTPAVTGTDTDTGIYYPSANEVAIATAGTQKAYVGEFAYLTSVSASNASLTLKKGAVGADAVDFLQMRDSSNNADFVVTGAGNISLFGGQITFPSTQSASANANTLDDYEEGTWTPSLLNGGTITTDTYAGTCTYTKIGRQVTLNFGNCTISGTPNNGTAIYITSLPFASTGSQFTASFGFCNSTSSIFQGFFIDGGSLAFGARRGDYLIRNSDLTGGSIFFTATLTYMAS
jgi:hypothetical protein